jgi:hypothetical protein
MKIEGDLFIDGGITANNPSMVALTEILGSHIGSTMLMVSIGSGAKTKNAEIEKKRGSSGVLRSLLTTVNNLLTDTQTTHEEISELIGHTKGHHKYYRLNDSGSLGEMRLDEWTIKKRSKSDVSAGTRDHIEQIFEKWSNRADVKANLTASAADIVQFIELKRHSYDKKPSREGMSVVKETGLRVMPNKQVFSLEGVPRVRHFVDRPKEMAQLEQALLPLVGQSQRQKVHVLRGLGGTGKTQLAVEFARRHYSQFSAVIWLNGSSEESVKRSLASYVDKISRTQMHMKTSVDAKKDDANLDKKIETIMGWLAQPDNTPWLMIFDNVNQIYDPKSDNPDAYDVRRFFSGADHGSILITTRLAKLEQLGDSQLLGTVNAEEAQAILTSWYSGPRGEPSTQLIDQSTKLTRLQILTRLSVFCDYWMACP